MKRRNIKKNSSLVSFIRNFGIAAHIDAGKTTLTERLLFYSGVLKKVGEVHLGNTTTDSMALEKQKGITIKSSAVNLSWNDHKMCLIDTPGHVDFSMEVKRSLRVLDGVICVLDASKGVEAQTVAVIEECNANKIPRIIFTNKMDKLGADFKKSFESVLFDILDCKNEEEALGKEGFPLIIAIPYWEEMELNGKINDVFMGCIDLVEMELHRWFTHDGKEFVIEAIPEHYKEKALAARNKLIETLCYYDEIINDKFCNQQLITEEDLLEAIRRNCLQLKICPMLPGSAYKNKCVEFLLDQIINFLPSPEDRKDIVLYKKNPENSDLVPLKNLYPSDSEFFALMFKKVTDKYAGSFQFIRIYSGVLRVGDEIWCHNTSQRHKVQKIFRIFVNERTSIEEAVAGDIIGLTLDRNFANTGNTISKNLDTTLFLEGIKTPIALISQCFIYKNASQEECTKLQKICDELVAEDPSLTYSQEENMVEFRGQGALHLEIILETINTTLGIKLLTKNPEVSYIETIGVDTYNGTYELKKQSGGRGQYAKIIFEIKKLPFGSGIQTKDLTKGNAIHSVQFKEAALEGFVLACKNGGLYGKPITDILITLIDGLSHAVDSTREVFQNCGIQALRNSVVNLNMLLLEPFVNFKIKIPYGKTPEEQTYFGSIIGYVSSKRGQVLNTIDKGNICLIHVQMPVSETFNLITDIRSLTAGKGDFSQLEFSSLEIVPDIIIKTLMKNQLLFFNPNLPNIKKQ